MAIADWSATPASNATVLGVNIGEGCAPSVVNDAIRKAMADVAAGVNFAILGDFLAASSLATARAALGVDTSNPEGLLPAGAVTAYAGGTVPSGYLECNGAAVSRSTYSGLFTAIGSTYGSGDGSTTFNLPDLRGEFVRGWDHGKGTDSGRVRGSSQSGQVEAHSHTLGISSLDQISHDSSVEGDRTVQIGGTATAGYVGSYGTGTETRPRNVAMMMIIKT